MKKETREEFVPSESLSHLYMEVIWVPEKKDREIYLEIKREVEGNPVAWEKLIEEVREAFRNNTGNAIRSLFVSFSKELQKNGLTEGAYSENGRFSEANIEELSSYLSIDTAKDEVLLKSFFETLFREFTGFLSAHEFRSEIMRAYLEKGKIMIERLGEFPSLDFKKLFGNEN
jgi:hypothetical protein